MRKSLIEEWFPVRELSRDAAIEMAYKAVPAYIKHCRELKIPERKIKDVKRDFYDPKIRSLHPWFARRPCSAARALTLAAVLPPKVNKKDFMKAIGWEDKPKVFLSDGYPPILFYTDPDRGLINELLTKLIGKRADEIVVCDPMAGGGTIPLESLRLGFKSIAVEYNPVAYLILKGTIEYPSLYGEELAQHVRDEIKRLISYSKETLGRFYPADSEGYIIARGIKCPRCGGKIPLLHEAQIAGRAYVALSFDASTKKFRASITRFPVELTYQSEKRGELKCPYCKTAISKKQAYKIWTENHVDILNELREGIFDEDKILSTHILLVKQTKDGYVICDEEDTSRFLEACKTLMDSFEEIEEYLPKSQIPQNNEVFSPIREYGIKRWCELFNPRQLLVIGTLVKYVHERSKELINKEELGAAISLYLAFGISRVVDYNSIVTSWKQGTIRDSIGRYAQGRKITYGEEYCEAIVPYRNLNWVFEPNSINGKKTEGGIYPILAELCKRVGNMGKNVTVIQGDCRFLSSVLQNIQVDVINVDPPYFDTHIYSDISEYFWQIFRMALKPFIDAGLLFKESNIDWEPASEFVPRKGEVIVRKSADNRRSKEDTNKPFNKEWYTNQMCVFFREGSKVLKDDGILLVWFTHRSLDAWETVISALYAAGFYVTKVWPVTSELLTRLVSKKNDSINTTLIIVARKRTEEKINKDGLEKHAIKMMGEMCEALSELGTTEIELRTFLQATAMCAVTRVPLPKDEPNPIQYIQSKLIPWAKKLAEEETPAAYRFKLIRSKGSKSKLEDFF